MTPNQHPSLEWINQHLKFDLFFQGNEGDIKWFVANSDFLWDITQNFKTLNLFLKVNFDVSFYSSCFFL
jgi:hypothetical protein